MSHLTFDDATEVRASALQSGSLVFFFSVLCPSFFSCLAFTSPLPESVPEQMPAHIRTYPGASSVPDAELMQSRRCGGAVPPSSSWPTTQCTSRRRETATADVRHTLNQLPCWRPQEDQEGPVAADLEKRDDNEWLHQRLCHKS